MDWASLVLRFGIGLMFVAHGMQLALGKFGGPGVTGFSQMLSKMGFAPAILWSYLAGYTTLIGGLFLLLGICVRLSAFSLLIFITVAAVTAHLPKGFFLQNGGYEYNFIIACACVALMILGGGKFGITKKF
jgi:putative oxidoreductase